MSKTPNTDIKVIEIKLQGHAAGILKQAVKFLEIFLPETLAKRFIALILLAVGVPVKTAIGLTGLSEKTLWTLHKQLSVQDVSEIMVFHYGGGRRTKADAAHFVMGCDFLGYIYGKTRRFVRTFSGRQRYNVLGALDYVSKKVHTVTNDSYITATEVCAMLRQVAAEYKDLPVHIVLDNARYQKCKAVQDLARELGIALEYIPPYSPNLNLIERIWKFVKGELRSKYYSDLDSFRQKIDSTICSISGSNKAKADTLIGKGILLYTNLKVVDGNTFACPEKAYNAA